MIGFELEEDVEALRQTVRRFAAEEIRPRLRDFEEAGGLSDAFVQGYLELGLSTLTLPEARGGLGMGLREACIVQEELAWGDIGVAAALPGLESVVQALEALGAPDQQALIPADRMHERGCVALLEPAPGFTLADTWTLAEADGDGVTLFGSKAFSLNAGQADISVVVAQTEPGSGEAGLRAFLIDRPAEGIAAGERHRLLGLETAWYGMLELSGCRVPNTHRLDGNGDFMGALNRFLDRQRLLAAARIVGACRAACEYALKYSTEREAFGKPLHEHQGIAFLLADMATRVDITRWQVWRAAWALDTAQPDAHRHVAMAFTTTAALAEKVTADAVQVLGGHGYIQDHPVEKWMRDVRTQAIIGGLEAFLGHDLSDAELGVTPENAGGAA